jgi:hypothetical protein
LYTIRQTYFDSVKYGGFNPAITSFSTFINITFKDSAKHLANLLPHQEILTNPYHIYNNGIRAIHKVTYRVDVNNRIEKSFGENCPNITLSPGNSGAAEQTGFTNVYINRNHKKIVGRRVTEGLGFTSELFNDGDRIYERCLIGYIKGADTSGTIYEGDPLLVKTYQVNSPFKLFPIPVESALFIQSADHEIYCITLINALGEKMLDNCALKQIDVSMLPNGIYFMIISGKEFTATEKIIVQH